MHNSPGPTLSGSSPARRGGGGRSRLHPRPGRSERLSPATTAALAHAWRPLWGSPAAGWLRSPARLGPQPRLSSALVAASAAVWLPAPAPAPGSVAAAAELSGPTPTRRTNQARHRPLTSPPRPARGLAPGVWVRLSSSLSSCARPQSAGAPSSS